MLAILEADAVVVMPQATEKTTLAQSTRIAHMREWIKQDAGMSARAEADEMDDDEEEVELDLAADLGVVRVVPPEAGEPVVAAREALTVAFPDARQVEAAAVQERLLSHEICLAVRQAAYSPADLAQLEIKHASAAEAPEEKRARLRRIDLSNLVDDLPTQAMVQLLQVRIRQLAVPGSIERQLRELLARLTDSIDYPNVYQALIDFERRFLWIHGRLGSALVFPVPGSDPDQIAQNHVDRLQFQKDVVLTLQTDRGHAGDTCVRLWALYLAGQNAARENVLAHAHLQRLLSQPPKPVGRNFNILRFALACIAGLISVEPLWGEEAHDDPYAYAEAAELLLNMDFKELAVDYYEPVPDALLVALHQLTGQLRVLPANKVNLKIMHDTVRAMVMQIGGARPVAEAVQALHALQCDLLKGVEDVDLKNNMALEWLLMRLTAENPPSDYRRYKITHALCEEAGLDFEALYPRVCQRWQAMYAWRRIGKQPCGYRSALGADYSIAGRTGKFYGDLGRDVDHPGDPVRVDQLMLSGPFKDRPELYPEFCSAYMQSTQNETYGIIKMLFTGKFLANTALPLMPLGFAPGSQGFSVYQQGNARYMDIEIIEGEVYLNVGLRFRDLKPAEQPRVLLCGSADFRLKMQSGGFVVDQGPHFSGPDAAMLKLAFESHDQLGTHLDLKPWRQPGHFCRAAPTALRADYQQVMAIIDALQAVMTEQRYASNSDETRFIDQACEQLYQLALVIMRDSSVNVDQIQRWHGALLHKLWQQSLDVSTEIATKLSQHLGEVVDSTLLVADGRSHKEVLVEAMLSLRAYGVSRPPAKQRRWGGLVDDDATFSGELKPCFTAQRIADTPVTRTIFENWQLDGVQFAQLMSDPTRLIAKPVDNLAKGWVALRSEGANFAELLKSPDLNGWREYGESLVTKLHNHLVDEQGCLQHSVLSAMVDFSGASPTQTHALTAEEYYGLVQDYATDALGSCLPDDEQGLFELMSAESPALDALKLWVETARSLEITEYRSENLAAVAAHLREAQHWSSAFEVEWLGKFHHQLAQIGRRAFAARTVQKLVTVCAGELDRNCMTESPERAAAMQFAKNTYLAAYKARNAYFTLSEAEQGWYAVPLPKTAGEEGTYQCMASGVALWCHGAGDGFMPQMPEGVDVATCLTRCDADAQGKRVGLLAAGGGGSHPSGADFANLLHRTMQQFAKCCPQAHSRVLSAVQPLLVVPCSVSNWQSACQQMLALIEQHIDVVPGDRIYYLESMIQLIAAMPVLPVVEGGISAQAKRKLAKPYLMALAKSGDEKARMLVFERLKLASLTAGHPLAFFHETNATRYRVDWDGAVGTATSATWYQFEQAMQANLSKGSPWSERFQAHNVGWYAKSRHIREGEQKQASAEGCLVMCIDQQSLMTWLAEYGRACLRDPDNQKVVVDKIVEVFDLAHQSGDEVLLEALRVLRIRGQAFNVMAELFKEEEPLLLGVGDIDQTEHIQKLWTQMQALASKRCVTLPISASTVGEESPSSTGIYVLAPAFDTTSLVNAWQHFLSCPQEKVYQLLLLENLAEFGHFIHESCFIKNRDGSWQAIQAPECKIAIMREVLAAVLAGDYASCENQKEVEQVLQSPFMVSAIQKKYSDATLALQELVVATGDRGFCSLGLTDAAQLFKKADIGADDGASVSVTVTTDSGSVALELEPDDELRRRSISAPASPRSAADATLRRLSDSSVAGSDGSSEGVPSVAGSSVVSVTEEPSSVGSASVTDDSVSGSEGAASTRSSIVSADAAAGVARISLAQVWTNLIDIGRDRSKTAKQQRVEARRVLRPVTGDSADVQRFYHALFEHSLRTESPVAFLHQTDATHYYVWVGSGDKRVALPTSHTFYDFTRAVMGAEAVTKRAAWSRQGEAHRCVALRSCAAEYQVSGAFFGQDAPGRDGLAALTCGT